MPILKNLPLGLLSFVLSIVLLTQIQAQSLSLSIGASAGYAPVLKYGNTTKSGAELALFGDLGYDQFIGRFQFTYVIPGTVSSNNLVDGYAFHGSLGYEVPVSSQVSVPIMLTGGVGIVHFTAYGSTGIFFDASPQIGLTVSPCYKLTDRLGLQLSARYIHGFSVDTRSDPIIMADLLLGIRYTIL